MTLSIDWTHCSINDVWYYLVLEHWILFNGLLTIYHDTDIQMCIRIAKIAFQKLNKILSDRKCLSMNPELIFREMATILSLSSLTESGAKFLAFNNIKNEWKNKTIDMVNNDGKLLYINMIWCMKSFWENI